MEDKFYKKFKNTIDSLVNGNIKIVLIDLNANVGSDNTDYEKTTEKHGL